MNKRITIVEVIERVEYALERMNSLKEDYTLIDVESMLEECEEKVEEMYNEFCSQGGWMTSRKLKFLMERRDFLVYTKHILQVTKAKSTKQVDDNVDVQTLSVRVLQKLDKIAYKDYLLRKNR